MRKVLNSITQEGEVVKSPEIDFFHSIAGSHTERGEENVIIDGKLHHHTPPIEEPYLMPLLTTDEENFFIFELSKNLVSFIGTEKDNVKKIKQCLMCNDFFIAKQKNTIMCKKRSCSNKYHAQDMNHRRKLAKRAAAKSK